jgi:hypothetical protein
MKRRRKRKRMRRRSKRKRMRRRSRLSICFSTLSHGYLNTGPVI